MPATSGMAPKSAALLAIAAWVVGAQGSHAQTTTASPTGGAEQSETTLSEVIVTAERRSEDVMKVPASISVLNGATLQQDHVINLEDISRAVPGVSFGAGGGPGLDNIEMRGVSSTSGSATVGLYLDDVPITTKNLYNGAVEPKLFDMDRVEILRGPQGTLYGASSEGGAIRFISNQPDLSKFSVTTSAQGSATVDGGGNYEAQAVVNQPIDDGRAALRFGVDVGRLSGWIDNLGCCGTHIPGVPVTDAPVGQTVNKDVNDEEWVVARLSSKLAVDDSLTITAAALYQQDNSGDTSVYYPQVGLYEQEKEVPEPIWDRLLVGSLTIEKDMDFAKLSSISSYFGQVLNKVQDATFYNSVYLAEYVIPPSPSNPGGYNNPNTYLIGQLPSPQVNNTNTRTLSQEFRLISNTSPDGSDKFSWVAGLFLSQYDAYNFNNQTVQNFTEEFTRIYGVSPTDSTVAGFQGVAFPNNSLAEFRFHVREQQIAGFANLTYSPIPSLKLTAGLRESYAPGFYKQDLSAGFFDGPTPVSLTYNTHFTSLTPKFSISYDVSQDATVYASAGKGNRLGGGNYYVPQNVCAQDLSNLGLTSAPTSYDTDTLWSYEGGLKGRFLNNKLSINSDFYYIEWHNIQQTINLPICGSQMNVNIGDAESYGPELEVNAKPIEDLTLGATFAYTHAAITKINPLYLTFGISPGQDLLNVPKSMASFRLEYSHPVTDDGKVFARADYDITGSSYGALVATDPGYRQPEYSVMNGSIGFSYRAYEISIFAKNLLNSSKVIQIPSLLFVPEAYTLRPLTIGVMLKAKL
jgi:iron complex outermembrane receptor protein